MPRSDQTDPRANVSARGVVFILLAAVTVVVLLVYGNNPPQPSAPKSRPDFSTPDVSQTPDLPKHAADEGFVSAAACRECHREQFQSWHKTYHRTMTQAATVNAVVPDWNDVTLESRGRTYRLFRRENEFWVDTIDPAAEMKAALQQIDLSKIPNPPRAERRIAMTTGSHLHQTYWMQNPNGTFLQFPWVYHINTKRWVFRIDSFLRPPQDRVTYNIWNMQCIGCHATGGQPRVDPNTHTMHSQGELGISCEACHGPGRDHVDYHRQTAKHPPTPESRMVDPRKRRPEVAAQVCGQCHLVSERPDQRRWLRHGDPYRAGGDNFEEIRRVVHYSEDIPQRDLSGERLETRFWPDGTVRTGGREYNGLIKSSCYLNGEGARKMTCISCHSMHDYVSPNKLIAHGREGNAACTQCHSEPIYDSLIQQHTHHATTSSGSQCVNCHMPHTSYALFSAIRSHRIQSPAVRPSESGARPNACNLCHLNQTRSWAAERLKKWYEIETPAVPVEDRRLAASVRWALEGDAAQRAIAAWHMGWDASRAVSDDRWMVPVLAELLDDRYSAVRYLAYESLKKHSGYEDLQYDFDGEPNQRREIRQHVLQQWDQQRGQPRPSASVGRLLQTPKGKWNSSLVKRMLQQQDDRPISLLE